MATIKRYRKQIVLAVACLLLLAGTAWAIHYHRASREADKVREQANVLVDESLERMKSVMDKSLRKGFSPSMFLPQEDERQRWLEFRKEVEKLAPAQRDQLQREMFQKFVQTVDAIATDLLQKPAEEQNKILDGFIALMQLAEAQRNRQGAAPSNPPLSPEERDRRRRQMLDSSTPQQRAHMSEGMRLMNQRLQQRGLPPLGAGRR